MSCSKAMQELADDVGKWCKDEVHSQRKNLFVGQRNNESWLLVPLLKFADNKKWVARPEVPYSDQGDRLKVDLAFFDQENSTPQGYMEIKLQNHGLGYDLAKLVELPQNGQRFLLLAGVWSDNEMSEIKKISGVCFLGRTSPTN